MFTAALFTLAKGRTVQVSFSKLMNKQNVGCLCVCVCVCVCVYEKSESVSHSVVSNSLQPHGP